MRLLLDTCFHEWGAASPEDFTASIIRVHSENSWFKNPSKDSALPEYKALQVIPLSVSPPLRESLSLCPTTEAFLDRIYRIWEIYRN